MIGWIVIALGIVVAALPVLDMSLSSEQKTALNLRVISVWSWLDEMKQKTFIDWLKRPKAQIVFLIFAALGFSIVVGGHVGNTWSASSIFSHSNIRNTRSVIIMCGCFVLSTPITIWVGRRLFSRIEQADTPVAKHRIVESVGCKAGAMGLVSLGALLLTAIVPYRWLGWIFVIVSVATATIGAFLSILTTPFTTASILGIILRISEFVVRKIGEYQSPTLALGVILGSIGACLKKNIIRIMFAGHRCAFSASDQNVQKSRFLTAFSESAGSIGY